MTIKLVLLLVFVSVAVNAQAPAKKKAAAESPAARAARIHKEAIVVDTHIDTTMMLGREGWDFMVRHSPVKGEDSNHVDLPRIREGGLDAAFFSI
jgi:membrane dipeptidase